MTRPSDTHIIPVILSGGAGTRLWPLSRTDAPKQLQRLVGEDTMIQATIARTPGAAGFAPPIIVAGAAHRAQIEAQMAEIGIDAPRMVLEPAGRNTAPAIALAALAALEDADDPLILVMPSDQLIRDVAAFRAAIARAAVAAAEDWLVTFGIHPGGPETGFGYIERGGDATGGTQRVKRFVEKPDLATAKAYVKAGNFSWNAGIFLMRARVYLDALKRYAPKIHAAACAAFDARIDADGILYPGADAFAASPSDSIDYAVMERAEKVAVVPVDMGWSDIGAFAALWAELDKDARGNAIQGDVIAADTDDCLLKSDGRLLAAVGVEGLVVMATRDAVLVLPKARAQDVKLIVEELEKQRRIELQRPV